MSPRVRLLAAAAAIAAALVGGPWVALAIAIAAAIATRRSASHAPARAFVAPLVTVAIAAVVVGVRDGVSPALALAARVAGVSAAAVWLVRTTPPHALVAALGGLGLPHALVDTLALAARYVGVLGDTMTTAREAQRVRLGWQRLPTRVRSFATLGGVVVARAVDQSVALGEAMRARGRRA